MQSTNGIPHATPHRDGSNHKITWGEYFPLENVSWAFVPIADETISTIQATRSHSTITRSLLIHEILDEAFLTGGAGLYDSYIERFAGLLEGITIASAFLNTPKAVGIAGARFPTETMEDETMEIGFRLAVLYLNHLLLMRPDHQKPAVDNYWVKIYEEFRRLAQRGDTQLLVTATIGQRQFSPSLENMLMVWLAGLAQSDDFPPQSFIPYLEKVEQAIGYAVLGKDTSSILPEETLGAWSQDHVIRFICTLANADRLLEKTRPAGVSSSALYGQLFGLHREFFVSLINGDSSHPMDKIPFLYMRPFFEKLVEGRIPNEWRAWKESNSPLALLGLHPFLTAQHLTTENTNYFVGSLDRTREITLFITKEILSRAVFAYSAWKANPSKFGEARVFFDALDQDDVPRIGGGSLWRKAKKNARHLLDTFDPERFMIAMEDDTNALLRPTLDALGCIQRARKSIDQIRGLPPEESSVIFGLYGTDSNGLAAHVINVHAEQKSHYTKWASKRTRTHNEIGVRELSKAHDHTEFVLGLRELQGIASSYWLVPDQWIVSVFS